MERRITLAPGTAQHFGPAVDPAAVRTTLGFGAGYADSEVRALLDQAVAFIEGLAGVLLRKGSYEVAWQGFPMYGGPLVIPGFAHLLSTIRYRDLSGNLETLVPAEYQIRIREPRRDMLIFPSSNTSDTIPETWPEEPIAYAKRDGVIASVVAGCEFDNDEPIPGDLKAAIMHSIRWIHDENMASKSIAMSLARKYYEHG